MLSVCSFCRRVLHKAAGPFERDDGQRIWLNTHVIAIRGAAETKSAQSVKRLPSQFHFIVVCRGRSVGVHGIWLVPAARDGRSGS